MTHHLGNEMNEHDERTVATGRGRLRAHARAGGSAGLRAVDGQAAGIDPARRDATARRRNASTERRLAAWLRTSGWPHAEPASRDVADSSDIIGTRSIVWVVEDAIGESVEAWLSETQRRRLDERADFGLLVVERDGGAEVGSWSVWLPAAFVAALMSRERPIVGLVTNGRWPSLYLPVRMELGDLVSLLRGAGYGEPFDDEVV